MKRISSRLVSLCAVLSVPGLALAGPVNVNSADAETLALELNGVGPVLAEAIIREREENGRFASAEDLTRVSGIGERIVERNRPDILVEDAVSTEE